MQSQLDQKYSKALLERFLRYVRVDTQSDEESTSSPSTEKQKDLARLLEKELKDLGLKDVRMNEWGYVFATLPSNLQNGPAQVPTIGLLAHMDTYFGTSGANVNPQIIDNYEGGDIRVTDELVLQVEENRNLSKCIGHTIIHTDGNTLLGADDKAGIAEIMTALEWMVDHPDFAHPEIKVGFTTDEEIGRGTEHFDVEEFGADYAYTLDGSDLGEIEDETFCADSAVLKITGYDVHPGYAKGKMSNALRFAAAVIENLDEGHLPETTEGRESYLHPYTMSGDVTSAEVKFLVRAFEVEELEAREAHLKDVIQEVGDCFQNAKTELVIEESYRNMGYKIQEDPKVLEYALEGVRRLGIEPKRQAIRGGTDGARLSFMGLLTPNIWAGGQNFHSVKEWVSLQWMEAATQSILSILGVWVEKSGK